VDIPNPPPTSTMHSNSDDGTLEHRDDVVLGNTEQSEGVKEISTNYVDSKITIVDIYSRHQLLTTFKKIEILNPWRSARSARTGTNGRRQLRWNWPRSLKERYSHQ
jgi:hypothetical protein